MLYNTSNHTERVLKMKTNKRDLILESIISAYLDSNTPIGSSELGERMGVAMSHLFQAPKRRGGAQAASRKRRQDPYGRDDAGLLARQT